MLTNYYQIDENETVASFLKELKEKKNMHYIILSTSPKSFVDMRTVALKMHQPNEKLKNLKKSISNSKGLSRDDHLAQLIESGDRVIGVEDELFDFLDAIDQILESNLEFLNDKVSNHTGKEVYALNENDKISSARNIFTQHGVNLLPVIEKLKIVGEVRTMDLLVDNLLTGNSESRGIYSNEKNHESTLNLPISNIMNPRPHSVNKSSTIREALTLMREKKLPSLIVNDNHELHSVISYRDIFKLVKRGSEESNYNIEVSGTAAVSDSELELIYDFCKKSMRKTSKISDYDTLKVMVKSHKSSNGENRKYSVKLLLSRGGHVLHIDKKSAMATNLAQLVHDALSLMERKVMAEKRKN